MRFFLSGLATAFLLVAITACSAATPASLQNDQFRSFPYNINAG